MYLLIYGNSYGNFSCPPNFIYKVLNVSLCIPLLLLRDTAFNSGLHTFLYQKETIESLPCTIFAFLFNYFVSKV